MKQFLSELDWTFWATIIVAALAGIALSFLDKPSRDALIWQLLTQ